MHRTEDCGMNQVYILMTGASGEDRRGKGTERGSKGNFNIISVILFFIRR
jgi:hypothetical protein